MDEHERKAAILSREQKRRHRQMEVMRGNKFALKHGWTSKKYVAPEYSCWVAMKTRCLNPKCEAFRYYGQRGITVCERWLSFENFIEDMGPRPSPLHSLDRYPDKNGDYEPSNCRWADKVQQQANRRTTLMVNYNGQNVPLSILCRELGLRLRTIWARIDRGMAPEKAIAFPIRPYERAR